MRRLLIFKDGKDGLAKVDCVGAANAAAENRLAENNNAKNVLENLGNPIGAEK